MEHTFAADGSLDNPFDVGAAPAEVFFFVGDDSAEDLGTGTLKIQKVSSSGARRNLKVITSLGSADDRSMRTILPANSMVDVTLSGSTNPNLSVEIQVGPRRNP